MQFIQRLLPALAAVVVSASAFAAPVVYTSSATFLAELTPGYYTETFDTAPAAGPSAVYTGSGYTYTASAGVNLYVDVGFLSTVQTDETVTLTFGANINAIGGDFFAVDIGDAFRVSTMTILFSDGYSETFTASAGDTYRGFTFDTAIASLTFTATPGGVGLYTALDNLTVGTVAVQELPEPASLALASLALAGLAATRRRSV